MDCIHCPQCYAYAYDTLVRPASRARLDMFEQTVNMRRITKAAHTLTPDFIRASVTPNDLSYIVLLCVEAGGVIPPKNKKRDAFAIMWLWMQIRLTDLGNMTAIHFEHSGGYAPELPVPPAPSPLGPLRIRIPRCPDGLYD
jgi:hypothetical protein